MTAASCLAQSGFAIKAEAVCTEEGRESAHGPRDAAFPDGRRFRPVELFFYGCAIIV